MKNQLTEKGIRAALKGGARRTLSDGGTIGAGALILTVRATGGGTWYFRHGGRAGREEYPIGPCDPTGGAGLSLAEARREADRLAKLVLSGVGSLSSHFAAQRAAEQAAAEAERTAQEAAEAALRAAEARAKADAERRATRTLRALVKAYADHLRSQGKPSWRRALNGPALHVPGEILDTPAADVRADHLLPPLRQLIDAGKGVAARLLRAHLRAAYALALSADSDPTVPDALRGFGIEFNPVDRIPARGFARFNRAGERALSWPELIAYRKKVEALPDGAVKDALLLALLLGGQRVAQLVRVKGADVDLHGGAVRLYDPKGKRTQPRRHILPLQGRALALLQKRINAPVWVPKKAKAKAAAVPSDADRPLLSHRDRRAIDPSELTNTVRAMAAEMLAAGEVREPFKLGDIRRTCETLLAGMRVPRDVRAHLLSHGLGGVQEVHYVRHDFLPEMREALDAWEARLYSENVVAIGERRAG
jgi:integrase